MGVPSLGLVLLFFAPQLAPAASQPESKAGAALFDQGLAHLRRANHPGARRDFQKAWDLGYHDAYLLYRLIEEDHTAADKPAGMAHFQLMLQYFPESPWMHVLLGNAAFEKDKDQQARSEYQQALALNNKLPVVNFRLGYLAYQSGADDAAARYFRNELVIDPGNPDANLFLGATLKREGKTESAIPYLRKAVTLDPGSALAYATLATALTETLRLTEAARVLEQGQKYFPSDPTFPSQLARLYTRLDRKRDAEQAAARARTLLALQNNKEHHRAKP